MEQHFVEFLSPGTFVSESTTKPIASWDQETAVLMASDIMERHSARPYGFRFLTRHRGPDDLDSKIRAKSGIFYLGGEIFTLDQVEARNLPDEEILRSNMRLNNIERIVVNTNSWKFTAALGPNDVVLEFALPHDLDKG